MRMKRRREEDKNKSLREERLAKNIPVTIDKKRVWDDELLEDEENMLGMAVDVEQLARNKRRKLEEAEAKEGTLALLKKREEQEAQNAEKDDDDEDEDKDEEQDDADSFLDESDVDESESEDTDVGSTRKARASSPAASVATTSATNMELSPEFLKAKFPQIFDPPPTPSILITTSLNSSLHQQAEVRSNTLNKLKTTLTSFRSLPRSSQTANTCGDPQISSHINTRLERLQNLHRIEATQLS